MLSGRRALLGLLQTLHQDLTGIADTLLTIRPHDIEAHPVESLGRALRRYSRPPGALAPTDVALATPASEAGLAWQCVARHAAVAEHAWATGESERFEPDMQWAGIADVASLADVLTRLDVGLMVWAAAEPDRRALSDTLKHGVYLALVVCARETLLLASRGPLPDVGPDRIPLPSLQILPVRSHAELPLAQLRLATLLERGGLIRPERFPPLAALQAKACLLLAQTLDCPQAVAPRAVSTRALIAALRRHANALTAATARRSSIAGYVPGDGRPVRQAAEISRMLQVDPHVIVADEGLLADVVQGVAGTTRALSTAASRALESGTWMVPNSRSSAPEPLWQAWTRNDPLPAPVAAIRKAAALSVDLINALTPPRPALADAVTARAALGRRGRLVTVPANRPAFPGLAATGSALGRRR